MCVPPVPPTRTEPGDAVERADSEKGFQTSRRLLLLVDGLNLARDLLTTSNLTKVARFGSTLEAADQNCGRKVHRAKPERVLFPNFFIFKHVLQST